MKQPFDFSGKTLFVAGGTSGINLGIAAGFAAAGARVAVCSRDQAKVDAAVVQIQSHGVEALGFRCDVRNYAEVEAALSGAHTRFGEFDVLISGAAGNFPAPALGMSANGFKAVVDIDLLGTFNVLRAAHPFLRKPGASVINISAGQASRPYKNQIHVCAAKAGVDQVTRVLALEWASDGIRVNSVAPGPIAETEGVRRLAPTPEAIAMIAKRVPLGRLGTKKEIADACMFLSSPFAQYITGIVLPVDGGTAIAGAGEVG